MQIIALVNQKGGVGKTTLAIHLATAFTQHNYAVVVLDLDPQASAAEWKDYREAELPAVQSIQPARLERVLAEAGNIGADIVILDTAPHSEGTALDAAGRADLVLVPTGASLMDLRALPKTVALLKLAKARKAFAVLNAVSPQPGDTESAAQAIETQIGLTVAPVRHVTRLIYKRCLTHGQTAQEVEPKGKAAEEISGLYEWTCRMLEVSTLRNIETPIERKETNGKSSIRRRPIKA
jgi:chromosome partitioning protein